MVRLPISAYIEIGNDDEQEHDMTPDEGRRVRELFDRLAELEHAPREADAEAAIGDGLRRAPHAIYALVQSVLVQDDALRAAQARIAELERGAGAGDEAPRGFLDSMRETLFGAQAPRGSVPSVPGGRMNGTGDRAPPSFLGTAAAAAVGLIGGSLVMNAVQGLMRPAGASQSAFDASSAAGGTASPSTDTSAPSELARAAGIDDVTSDQTRSQSLFGSGDARARSDDAGDDNAFDSADFDDFDFDSDFG